MALALDKLNPQQRAAVEAVDGPLLFVRADSRMPRTSTTVSSSTMRHAGQLKPKCQPGVYSVFFCVLLMSGLPVLTWVRFFLWLAIGLVIYFFYSRHRSEFSAAQRSTAPQED